MQGRAFKQTHLLLLLLVCGWKEVPDPGWKDGQLGGI